MRHYVLKKNSTGAFKNYLTTIFRFVGMAVAVASVFLVSFSPFILTAVRKSDISILKQIIHRLFPTARGLIHSYWAPNFYAVYSFLDKVLFFNQKLKDPKYDSINTTASGIVNLSEFDFLPNINANCSNFIVIILILALIVYYLVYPSKSNENNTNDKTLVRQSEVLKILFASGFIFFNFGYHVHEKALISLVIVASILAYIDQSYYKLYFQLDIVCLVVQLPLIHERNEYYTKLGFTLTYCVIKLLVEKFKRVEPSHIFTNIQKRGNMRIALIITGLILLDFLGVFIPHLSQNDLTDIFSKFSFNSTAQNAIRFLHKYQFAPLMFISVISSILVQILCLNFIK